MNKNVMVLGTGAQGSTIAMRLDEEANVARIICADYNLEAAQRLERKLTKATAVKVEVFGQKTRDYYFREAAKLGITVDEIQKTELV